MPSLRHRSPPSPSPAMGHELKQRVIACLNRLADRDTLALAAAELDSIARGLSPENFSPFISCLHNTDTSARLPVRKHCVSLLSLLSRSHGDCLAPHLSKMVSTVLSRLRDPESAVRAACAAAVADMSSSITATPFSLLSGPIIEKLLHDRDPNAQTGAAMCLAAVVDAAAEPDMEQLTRTLPKMAKLLKSEGFKAKPELLGAIRGVMVAGGGGCKGVTDWLVPCVTEFLSNEDWRARKAAAEALATVEEDLAPVYKEACLAVLESRRFDKVKLVRETMNRTLEIWRRVQGDVEEVSVSPSQPKSSNVSSGYHSLKTKHRLPNTPSSSVSDTLQDQDIDNLDQEAPDPNEKHHPKLRVRRKLFDKTQGCIDSRFASRIVPCNDEENPETDTVRTGEVKEELSQIQIQIAQIEKQQSNMLDLLQRFAGSSQSEMQSLESRVRSLETALDVISRNLTVSCLKTRRETTKETGA
ncbi:PREDICTED: LOW QUALITY PROTEIN: microtubule-associated protein TORTIFOLIA1 [Tarenaya hassleriana]|uniref:LOW QUALITY PROTEIN: microtubule-associated protein TORTIFOLIA1 n=1 Tax=Tarenaya hassleriana TaxID=28532 RepID=UPI00053C9841|nr:PREDICTED: LOW QUALITY PROTEIN: microtubule-associated protein TORTIFOLIA1 [Tarenaya hassleriana]